MKKDLNKFTIDQKDGLMLLMIDFQDKLGPQIKGFDKIVEKTVILKKAFDLFGLKYLATEQYPKGLGRTDQRLLNLLDEENIVSKTTFDSYTERIKEFVKKENIKKVIVTGAETHVCVYQTVRSMLKDGLDVYLVEDAVSSYDKFLKKNALNNLKEMGALVLSSENLLFDLVDGKDSENFKEISSFVKDLRKI